MPFLLPTVLEFAIVSADGKSVGPDEAGRFRITDDGKNPVKVEVKPCADHIGDVNDWREAKKGELDFLKRAYEQYAAL